MTGDPLFDRRLGWTSAILTMLLAALAWGFHSSGAALSVVAGSAISFINFRWLKQAVNFIAARGGTDRVGKRVALQYAGRYALIGLLLYVTIRVSILVPAFVLGGLLIYVLAILLEAVIEIATSLFRDYRNGRT